MRVRHVVENERVGRKVGHEPGVLDSGEDEEYPKDIDELGGEQQGPQGNARRGCFGNERRAVMAYEQLTFQSPDYADAS